MVHQSGAVVDGTQLHAGRQAGFDLRQLLLQILRHDLGVLPHEHEAQAEDRLAPALRCDPPPDLLPDLHVGHVADADGHPVLGGDDDARDLRDVLHAAPAVDQQHLRVLADALVRYFFSAASFRFCSSWRAYSGEIFSTVFSLASREANFFSSSGDALPCSFFFQS